MSPDLQQAYKASRQRLRGTARALSDARANLAKLEPTKARLESAYAARNAVVDKRRYAPENVAAVDEVRAATADLSRLRHLLTPSGRNSCGATLGAPFAIGGHKSAMGQWCENPPFRFVGLASDIVRSRQTGWYTDADGSNGETARGVVYQLTGRDGQARYLPAIADPCNSGKDGSGPAVLAFGEIEEGDDEAKESAAHRADQLAEYYAEESREYDEAWQAGSRFSDLGEEVANLRGQILTALAERRKVSAAETPALCAMLRSKIGDMLDSIREVREERRNLQDNYARYKSDAFNDGAGLA